MEYDEYAEEIYESIVEGNISRNFQQTKNLLNYYFGIEEKYLTKENLKDRNNFSQLLFIHSKKSELEKELEEETHQMLKIA